MQFIARRGLDVTFRFLISISKAPHNRRVERSFIAPVVVLPTRLGDIERHKLSRVVVDFHTTPA